jgi:Sigma-70, region 4
LGDDVIDNVVPITRDQRRSRRAWTNVPRAESIGMRELKAERRHLTLIKPPAGFDRPKTRGDCADGLRPCPWVSCAYHLLLDVSEATGALKMNFPGLDFDEIPETCALDLAELGGIRLEQAGQAMNITRERVRQIEVQAFEHLRGFKSVRRAFDEFRQLRGEVDERQGGDP